MDENPYGPVKDAIEYAEAVLGRSWDRLRDYVGVDHNMTPQTVAKCLHDSALEFCDQPTADKERAAGFRRAQPQLLTPLFYQYVAGKLGLV